MAEEQFQERENCEENAAENMAPTWVSVDQLQSHGISVGDINKLKAAVRQTAESEKQKSAQFGKQKNLNIEYHYCWIRSTYASKTSFGNQRSVEHARYYQHPFSPQKIVLQVFLMQNWRKSARLVENLTLRAASRLVS